MKKLFIPLLEKKFLLAEDNQVNQEVVVDMLEQLGYRIDIVNNGKEAVEACQKYAYSLILMDCEMPVMDGLTATEKIRADENQLHKPSVPVVALTAHAVTGVREKCIASGMSDFLSKPFSVNEIHVMVKKWVTLEPEHMETESGADPVAQSAASESGNVKPVPTFHGRPQDLPDDQSGRQNSIIDNVMINRLRQTGQRKNPRSVTKASLLVRVITMYLEQTPELLVKLSIAMQEKNIIRVVDVAHSLKSSSSAVGAVELAESCREIEQAGCKDEVDISGLEQWVCKINDRYQKVEIMLKKILDSES